MCRFWAVHADRAVSPAEALHASPTSLAAQSRRDRAGDHHRDGWGIGWYADGRPHVVRGVLPACDDPQFAATAKSLSSSVFVAHIRDASVGPVREENCHPFTHGPWLFCHNGTIEKFERLRTSFERETPAELRAARRGDTDSEHLFLWLLGGLAREGYAVTDPHEAGPRERVDTEGLYGVLHESLRRLLGRCAASQTDEPTGLNLVLTDGRVLAAVRFGRTLWTQSRAAPSAERPAIVVASEPTDGVGPWREADDRSILTIDAAGRLLVRPL
jgi:glutamine amidotransferase